MFSTLYINSDDRTTKSYSDARYESSNILQQNIKQIGIKDIHIENDIPNINTANNAITFFTDAYYTVFLTPGYYPKNTIITQIITQLNASPAAIVFSEVVNGDIITLNGSVPFRFVSTRENQGNSSHIDKGRPNSGLYSTTNLITSMIVRPRGLYTEYIDFIAPLIKDGQSIANLFTKDNTFGDSGHLFRAVLTSNTFTKQIETIHYSLLRQKKIDSLEIRVYDQWGDLLFEEYNNNNIVDTFRYNLELSILI